MEAFVGRRMFWLLGLCVLVQAAEGDPRFFRKGMVVSQERLASEAGQAVLRDGGNAIDAAVATAFALAVTHPIAGNIGGGGFMLVRLPDGRAEVIDFRETAPQKAHPGMWMPQGTYDPVTHHERMASVGIPGTVAGLHLAWKRHGKLPWQRLVAPAIRMAKDGIEVTPTLASSLKEFLPQLQQHGPTFRVFTREGRPLEAGDRWRQPDLARTLQDIAKKGPSVFYRGRVARLLVAAMEREGGLITRKDLAAYKAVIRTPLRGNYRGYEVLALPPPSSGGQVLLANLAVLEGWSVRTLGRESADLIHLAAESMRCTYRDRAKHLGDPDGGGLIPVANLLASERILQIRQAISMERAGRSQVSDLEDRNPSEQTTHLSVVDGDRGAVSLTYTLEDNYGVKRVVPGAGFLLNNELGDFNAGPGVTDERGRIGTEPNLARPGRRPLSSMCPVMVLEKGALKVVAGSPGGRTIPNTVLWTLLGVLDFGLSPQQAVDAPRWHHQWLPDVLYSERGRLPETVRADLVHRGHRVVERPPIGVAQIICVQPDGTLEGGTDRTRWAESAAVGY